MFQKLKEHWKVNGINLALIIITFAIGGSLCGYLGRKLLLLSNIDKGIVWVAVYILLITLLWPVCVILISLPFGQFSFFKRYLIRIWKKVRGEKLIVNTKVINIAIFASGAGSNAQQIINYFSSSALIKIALIVCNNPQAGVLSVAAKANIPYLLIDREHFFNGDHYSAELQKSKIDFIVLAGFLWKVPEQLIKKYPRRIINIHPALLPKYGGKGMFGNYIHEAIIAAKEKESGITIHYVDELYDHGEIIFQTKCTIEDTDTADKLSKKIQMLEHQHYPVIIDTTVQKQKHS